MHSDLSGHTTPNGGTIPANLATLKPDITALNVEKKLFEILDLMVPFEDNITSRHKYKSDYYAHFTSDISTHNTTVTAFEVGAKGFLTEDNSRRLKDIYVYKHTTTKICQKTCIQNCSALAILKVVTFSHPVLNPNGPSLVSCPLL